MVRDKIFPVEVNGRGTISHIVAKQRILQIILYTATKYHLVSSLFSIFFALYIYFRAFWGGTILIFLIPLLLLVGCYQERFVTYAYYLPHQLEHSKF